MIQICDSFLESRLGFKFGIQVWDLIWGSCLGYGFGISVWDSGFGFRFRTKVRDSCLEFQL